MNKKRRPINDREKASAYMINMLERIREWVKDKDLSEEGAMLRVTLLIMHTQALAFQLRPELIPFFLDEMEGFMIEVKMTNRDANGIRQLATELMESTWKRIDRMVTDVDDKLDA